MDYYVSYTILLDIHSYISWNDLRRMNNVPDIIWEQVCNYFCKDDSFKSYFWNKDLYTKQTPYRRKFLTYIFKMLKTVIKGQVYMVTPILSNDKDFILSSGYNRLRKIGCSCLTHISLKDYETVDTLHSKYAHKCSPHDRVLELYCTCIFYNASPRIKQDPLFVSKYIKENPSTMSIIEKHLSLINILLMK